LTHSVDPSFHNRASDCPKDRRDYHHQRYDGLPASHIYSRGFHGQPNIFPTGVAFNETSALVTI
jgi:hypothetical protein